MSNNNNTTSINDLPLNPANSGGLDNKNITFTANEINSLSDNNLHNTPNNISLDQSTINQIVNGIQQASSSGLTQLQTRDIPQSTENYTQDPQIQPDYIPTASNKDYINEYEDNNDIIEDYSKKMITSNNLDQLYDELQTPLLIAVLFFLFQLPIFKKFLFIYIPFLFLKDGNINIYGYLFTSILFGFLYYTLSKIMTVFNKF